MERISKATVSFAIILLTCFFLPWVQVSCGASHDTATGLDLARDGNGALWLIPLLTLVLVLCGLRLLRINQTIYGMIALLSGLVSLYLMNHERVKFEDNSGLISARLTGWFWLGLMATIGIVVRGAFGLLRRSRSP
ncbi:MAG: hypothetical protein M3R68_09265 [Acidobacteriota bacterium]|nr:hypothetical protein [Acidobacteriota bacterium]